jgi:hypothetical protein
MEIKVYESESPIFRYYESLPWWNIYRKLWVRYKLWRVWRDARDS